MTDEKDKRIAELEAELAVLKTTKPTTSEEVDRFVADIQSTPRKTIAVYYACAMANWNSVIDERDQLKAEVEQLRTALLVLGKNTGCHVSNECSSEFLCLLAEEVELRHANAFRAAIISNERTTWQPMETAHRDGSQMLLRPTSGPVVGGHWDELCGDWRSGERIIPEGEVTGWARLPKEQTPW